MLPLEKSRRFEVRVDGSWTPCHFEQIQVGDVFRSYDGDNLVTDTRGSSVFIASREPYVDATPVRCTTPATQSRTVWAVMLDYSIRKLPFGCPEMYEARVIYLSESDAEQWVAKRTAALQWVAKCTAALQCEPPPPPIFT